MRKHPPYPWGQVGSGKELGLGGTRGVIYYTLEKQCLKNRQYIQGVFKVAPPSTYLARLFSYVLPSHLLPFRSSLCRSSLINL